MGDTGAARRGLLRLRLRPLLPPTPTSSTATASATTATEATMDIPTQHTDTTDVRGGLLSPRPLPTPRLTPGTMVAMDMVDIVDTMALDMVDTTAVDTSGDKKLDQKLPPIPDDLPDDLPVFK